MLGLNTIARRLPLALVVTAALVSLGVGYGGYLIGSQMVGDMTRSNLSSLAYERAKQVEDFVHTITGDLETTANSQATNQAIRDFGNAWLQIPGDRAAVLQKAFVTDNPNEQKMMLDAGPSDINYSLSHSKYNPGFRQQLMARGYSDIYLIGADGSIYYTVAKGSDFTVNVLTDATLKQSGLARVFTAATAQPTPGGPVVFSDFAPYGASGEVSAFVGLPLFNAASGRMMGILAFRFSPALLASVVGDRTGLGDTGEVLVVGSDHLLRVDSTFDEENNVLKTSLGGGPIDAALAGTVASGGLEAYRDGNLLAAAAPVRGIDAKWAVAAVISKTEAFAPIVALRNVMLAIGGGLLLIAAVAGLVFARSVTGPITRLTGAMKALAEGDLAVEVKGAGRSDEIGEMARTVEVFRENALRIMSMTDEERAASEQRGIDRSTMMRALQQAFGEVVDAAQQGDFGKRVEAEFPDRELNEIAASINNLVETVERGLGETGRVLSALAQTDLTHRVDGEYEGAFRQLKDDTNAVAETLGEIIGRLKETSRTLKTATSEILSGANDLSERTTKQAATIEETSAAMEQLANAVTQNAQQAQQASIMAATVTRTAEEGGVVMGKATDAMERIIQSSGKISNIIGLIDDVAFQTNLLALNASVEAARAGEAGKGFAVVAVEVRRLAQSAAQASSEVKGLVEQSGIEVRTGSKLSAARSSNEAMDGIARQSQDQAASIEEVNAAVRTMDEMTQHNAALVEQTNASIERTEEQASELDRIVEVFTTAEPAPPMARPSPALRTPPVAAAQSPARGIKGLQERVRSAAKAYLSHGNAAVDKEWEEF
jgi:methyl-accepting chemotaxis protein